MKVDIYCLGLIILELLIGTKELIKLTNMRLIFNFNVKLGLKKIIIINKFH